jgi:hypothetical protein
MFIWSRTEGFTCSATARQGPMGRALVCWSARAAQTSTQQSSSTKDAPIAMQPHHIRAVGLFLPRTAWNINPQCALTQTRLTPQSAYLHHLFPQRRQLATLRLCSLRCHQHKIQPRLLSLRPRYAKPQPKSQPQRPLPPHRAPTPHRRLHPQMHPKAAHPHRPQHSAPRQNLHP